MGSPLGGGIDGGELGLGARGIADGEVVVGHAHAHLGIGRAGGLGALEVILREPVFVHAAEDVGGLDVLSAGWGRGIAGAGLHEPQRDLPLGIVAVTLLRHHLRDGQAYADAIRVRHIQGQPEAIHRRLLIAKLA